MWLAHCLLRRPAGITLERWGCRLSLPAGLRRGATAIYLFRDAYEPELAHLGELVRPGATFVDAGASVGLYTVVAASLVGPSGSVLAFEPAKESYAVLCKNVELNGFRNVVTFQKALADGTGTAKLYHFSGAPNYSLGEPPTPAASEAVETTTLDEVMRHRQVGELACIKLDVEGAESLVLRGAAETLQRFRPAVILEVDDVATSRVGMCKEAAVETLRGLGYRFELAESGHLLPMPETPSLRNVIARPA